VSTSSGGNANAVSLFGKLKALNQFYKDSPTTLYNNLFGARVLEMF